MKTLILKIKLLVWKDILIWKQKFKLKNILIYGYLFKLKLL